MVKMGIRHFVTKKGRYHYWQPSKTLRDQGFKPIRLADNLSEAVAEAERLNASIDRWRTRGEQSPGDKRDTIAWSVRQFTRDAAFTDLAEATRRVYLITYKDLERRFGDLSINAITRKFIYEYRDQFENSPRRANQVVASIQSLLRFCFDRQFIKEYPAEKIRMHKVKARSQIWSLEQEEAFIETATNTDRPFLVLGMALGIYTAQRLGDILALPWSGYSHETQWISLIQQKTKKHVDVPVLSPLRSALEQTPKRSTIIVVDHRGRPFTTRRFRSWFSKTCAEAGIEDLQFRDLRRTAVVRMAEQGVEIATIAAITGHSLTVTEHIMETYLPRTKKMAARVIDPMEKHYRDSGR